MTENRDNEHFLQQARQALDDSTRDLDELTVARLRAARRRAVDLAYRDAADNVSLTGSLLMFSHGRGWLLPVVLAAIVLTTALTMQAFNRHAASYQELDAESMEILSAVDSLETLENLEFYQWLNMHEGDNG